MLEKEKLTFHPISLEDRDWMTQKLQEDDLGACEYTFANNFINRFSYAPSCKKYDKIFFISGRIGLFILVGLPGSELG